MFVDKAKIFIKAGNGGNGCTSFYTEKFIANGGPDGGDGGNGGSVIFVSDSSINTLLDFQYVQHYRAEDGEKGDHRFSAGKRGKDLVIKVPCGTIIRDCATGKIIDDMFADGKELTVLEGGAGGKGNAHFKSSRRQAPHFSQTGQKTVEQCVYLELKTIADVGLVGYPNVGKSTLLSMVSSAKPKIANYHFTTLSPNLGVVKYHSDSFVVADIPGLIDGASDGLGLGIDFLKHIERTRLIVHVIDISGIEGRDPLTDYHNIKGELKKYSPELAKLPVIIALNKTDLLGGDDMAVKEFRRHVRAKVVAVSGATHEGVEELISTIATELKKIPKAQPMVYEKFVYTRPDITNYEIARDDDGAYVVFGGMMDELARNVVLDNIDSFNYFQKTLKEKGIIKALRKAGANDGDTVRILDFEFEFVD